mgnify:CR=1 FL=1
MSFVRRLPWWARLLLLVVVLLAVQEVRVRWAVAARPAHPEPQFRARRGAVPVPREDEETVKGGRVAEKARLEADLGRHKARLEALAPRGAETRTAVERSIEAGRQLVATGSLADVLRALEALGVKPIAAARPRP